MYRGVSGGEGHAEGGKPGLRLSLGARPVTLVSIVGLIFSLAGARERRYVLQCRKGQWVGRRLPVP